MDADQFFKRLGKRSIFSERDPLPIPRGRHPPSLEQFRAELAALDGESSTADRGNAREVTAALAARITPATFAVAGTPLLAELGIAERLERAGMRRIVFADDLRHELDGAALAVVEADLAIAESGTIVLVASKECPRLLTCLATHLIVLLDPARLVARLEDVPGWLAARGALPSAVALISGPSATGDVDQHLVIGAHGPAHVHVIALA